MTDTRASQSMPISQQDFTVLQERRTPVACTNCRLAKKKCKQEKDLGACERCSFKQLHCQVLPVSDDPLHNKESSSVMLESAYGDAGRNNLQVGSQYTDLRYMLLGEANHTAGEHFYHARYDPPPANEWLYTTHHQGGNSDHYVQPQDRTFSQDAYQQYQQSGGS